MWLQKEKFKIKFSFSRYQIKRDIKKFYTRNIKLIKKIDIICTKFPEYWESIIINE